MDFLGLDLNSRLKRGLSDTIDSGKLPHAVILEGGTSEARVKLARLLAAALVCESKGEKPCVLSKSPTPCKACVKAFGQKPNIRKLLDEKLNHADILEVEKEPDKVQFGINPVRTMRKEAYIIPNEADAKVYILLDAHLLNPQAQNALLKILEEPPSYLCFILECASKNVLLPTVLSRAVCFSLGRLEPGEGMRAKKMESVNGTAANIAAAIASQDGFELLKATAVFEKDKNNKTIALCLQELELIVRDALVMKFGIGETFSSSPQSAKTLAEKLPKAKLIQLIDEVRLLYEATERSANKNLTMTRLSAKLGV